MFSSNLIPKVYILCTQIDILPNCLDYKFLTADQHKSDSLPASCLVQADSHYWIKDKVQLLIDVSIVHSTKL